LASIHDGSALLISFHHEWLSVVPFIVLWLLTSTRWWLSVVWLLLPPSGYTLSCGFLLLDKHLVVAMLFADVFPASLLVFSFA
jgi:hypothetical protein